MPCPEFQSQPLSYPLRQLPLSKVPHVHQALFGEVDVLHRGHVLGRGLADARGNDDGVGLENDAVVDELIDGEGLFWLVLFVQVMVCVTYHEVVVLDDGAFIDRVPALC
jgi:hypothetical protein